MMHCTCVHTQFNYFSHVVDRRRSRNRCFQVFDEMASAEGKNAKEKVSFLTKECLFCSFNNKLRYVEKPRLFIEVLKRK